MLANSSPTNFANGARATGAGALTRGGGVRPDASLSWAEQREVLKRVMPLLWPQGENALKFRAVFAFSLILVAKIVNVSVPLVYKHIVDAMTGDRKSTRLNSSH